MRVHNKVSLVRLINRQRVEDTGSTGFVGRLPQPKKWKKQSSQTDGRLVPLHWNPGHDSQASELALKPPAFPVETSLKCNEPTTI